MFVEVAVADEGLIFCADVPVKARVPLCSVVRQFDDRSGVALNCRGWLRNRERIENLECSLAQLAGTVDIDLSITADDVGVECRVGHIGARSGTPSGTGLVEIDFVAGARQGAVEKL